MAEQYRYTANELRNIARLLDDVFDWCYRPDFGGEKANEADTTPPAT